MSSLLCLTPYGKGYKTWYNSVYEQKLLSPELTINVFDLLPIKCNPYVFGNDFLILYEQSGYKNIEVFLKKHILPEDCVKVQKWMIEKDSQIFGEIYYLAFDYKELLNRVIEDYKKEIIKAKSETIKFKKRDHVPWVDEALGSINTNLERMESTLKSLKERSALCRQIKPNKNTNGE